MFTRFRSMPATAMAAVLGCALMATAAPASAQKKEKPKKGEEAKEGLSASKEFGPALKKMTEDTTEKDAAALQAALTEGKATATDRKSVAKGKRVSERVDPGGRPSIKKKKI